ncbi:uncharacterized protein KRP23_234 [Phytophthora ramorum]|uniref:uncharacterized protein n=1 Tax=Phytophthora ramorum TaxID=164328 RepID=UPI0030B7A62F|nr:hypothetical protein KRP23_234 [Phytophthora ramorum]
MSRTSHSSHFAPIPAAYIAFSANPTHAEPNMAGIGLRREVLALYRDVLRVAREFPERSMGRKLQYNARELLRLRQHERNAARIQTHLTEGRDALHVYRVLQQDPALLTAITRKKKPSAEAQEK